MLAEEDVTREEAQIVERTLLEMLDDIRNASNPFTVADQLNLFAETLLVQLGGTSSAPDFYQKDELKVLEMEEITGETHSMLAKHKKLIEAVHV